MIIFSCSCGQKYHLPNRNAGREVRCNQCGKTLVVPNSSDEAANPFETAPAIPTGGDVSSEVKKRPAYSIGALFATAVIAFILGSGFGFFSGIMSGTFLDTVKPNITKNSQSSNNPEKTGGEKSPEDSPVENPEENSVETSAEKPVDKPADDVVQMPPAADTESKTEPKDGQKTEAKTETKTNKKRTALDDIEKSLSK